MKRWTVRICVLLLLGAIVNVAVAWALEYRGKRGLLAIQTGPAVQPRVNPIVVGSGTVGSSAQLFGEFGSLGKGWPMPALSRDFHMEMPGVPRPSNVRIGLASPYRNGQGAYVRLPLRPIWLGFAINTVIYAAVLWGLFAVPLALRKRRRIKRGLCPKCAYDLRGRTPTSSVCPECGNPSEAKHSMQGTKN